MLDDIDGTRREKGEIVKSSRSIRIGGCVGLCYVRNILCDRSAGVMNDVIDS